MTTRLNYIPFLGILSLGYFIGICFPDIDQNFHNLLGHRSIVTHSILLPFIVEYFLKKKKKITKLKVIFVSGIYLGIGLHLSADLHPKGWGGFANIKLPGNNSIGGLSPIWIGINAIFGFYFAATNLRLITSEKKYLLSYLSIAIIFALLVISGEPYNNGEILITFLILLFVTYFYSKKKGSNLMDFKKNLNIQSQGKKVTKKKLKGGFWSYLLGSLIIIPLILIVVLFLISLLIS